MTKASFSSDVFSQDKLLAGNAHLLTGEKITIESGQNLTRGAVLGKITGSGKYVLSLSGAADGSQTPDLILAEDTDASSGDQEAMAYMRGDFNVNALTIGTGHTADSIKEGLRNKGILLFDSIGGA